MKYTNSYKVSIDFLPWFDKENGHHKLMYVHMYEELGGRVAYGEIQMMNDGSSIARNLIETEYKGKIILKDEKPEGLIYEIPIFIINRNFENNYVTLYFICIEDKKFVTDLHQMEYTKIKETIDALYPGKKEFRVETDIQNPELKYYQNNETDHDFIERLCYSYKRESVFAFGWEGFMIKETYGKLNHKGENEKDPPKIWLREDANLEQIDPNFRKYDPEIYHLPYNPWENAEKEGEDYSEWEPKNLRFQKRYDGIKVVHTDYLPLQENRKYNLLYMRSNFFNNFRIRIFEMPRYKIGDVIVYKKEGIVQHPNITTWPYKLFLVRSNELFMSTEECNEFDDSGFRFSWTSNLMGLEENGSLALGTELDPTDQ